MTTATWQELGLGARITVGVMDDEYVRMITEAVAQADSSDLLVETGDVSTLVRGTEQRVTEYLRDLLLPLAKAGVHTSASLMFSRGCPGELECAVPARTLRTAGLPDVGSTGVQVAAEWSLYPLADGTDDAPADHMRDIYTAIDLAKDRGTYVSSEHFVTRLEGDLGDVLGTIAGGWVMAGQSVQHVTSHAVLSLNSPTPTLRSR